MVSSAFFNHPKGSISFSLQVAGSEQITATLVAHRESRQTGKTVGKPVGFVPAGRFAGKVEVAGAG